MVLDASTALASCFPDEASDRADRRASSRSKARAVTRTGGGSLEIGNALLVGERRKLRQPEVLRVLTLFESLPVIEDTQTAPERVRNVLPIAVRRGAALATV